MFAEILELFRSGLELIVAVTLPVGLLVGTVVGAKYEDCEE